MEGCDLFCSWSGGKESTLALDRAIRTGYEVNCLVNMVSSEKSNIGHGLPPEFYSVQAESLNIPIKQKEVEWETYEEDLSDLIREVSPIEGIFGDVYLLGHKEWIEDKARQLGFDAIWPLWMENPEQLYLEYLNRGFEALIIKVRPEKIPEDWIGQRLNKDFLEYLKKNEICPLGEKGEYHTVTLGGPLFDRNICVELGEIKEVGGEKRVELESYGLI